MSNDNYGFEEHGAQSEHSQAEATWIGELDTPVHQDGESHQEVVDSVRLEDGEYEVPEEAPPKKSGKVIKLVAGVVGGVLVVSIVGIAASVMFSNAPPPAPVAMPGPDEAVRPIGNSPAAQAQAQPATDPMSAQAALAADPSQGSAGTQSAPATPQSDAVMAAGAAAPVQHPAEGQADKPSTSKADMSAEKPTTVVAGGAQCDNATHPVKARVSRPAGASRAHAKKIKGRDPKSVAHTNGVTEQRLAPSTEATAATPLPAVTLRAVLPGTNRSMAVLENSEGQMARVLPGEQAFGVKVTSIDLDARTVTTDRGVLSLR